MRLEAIRQHALQSLPSCTALLIGLGYLVGPIDLIPDRTPYIGHLDEAVFALGGVALAAWLAPASLGLMAQARRSGMAVVSATLSRALFRLCLGRWPNRMERALFAQALADNRVPVPALLRAMDAVPDSRVQISRLLLLGMVREGRLPAPERLGGEAVPIAPQVGNPLSFWEGPAVSFLHIEKTAGTALATALTERFHPLQIDPDPHRTMPPHVRTPFAAPACVRDRKLVWGHYDLPSLERLGSERVVVMMLRDPGARIVSLYRYWRSIDAGLLDPFHNGPVRLAHEHDLLGFLRHGDPLLRDMIDNVYVRRLTGFYASVSAADPVACDPGGVSQLALQALERVDFVGVVERMEDSVRGLSAAIGTALSVSRDNASEGNAAVRPGVFRAVGSTPVTPEVADELDRLTSLDRVVYRAALRRLEGGGAGRAAA
jgi:hypothetical protein